MPVSNKFVRGPGAVLIDDESLRQVFLMNLAILPKHVRVTTVGQSVA